MWSTCCSVSGSVRTYQLLMLLCSASGSVFSANFLMRSASASGYARESSVFYIVSPAMDLQVVVYLTMNLQDNLQWFYVMFHVVNL